jgi:hypothetical protein
LGVFLIVSALRGLFIGPGLEALAGFEGEIWSGNFDFTLIRPVNTQFLVSLRKWRLFSLFDLVPGLGILGIAIVQLRLALDPGRLLSAGAVCRRNDPVRHLARFAALVFWSPGVFFTWFLMGCSRWQDIPGDVPRLLRLADLGGPSQDHHHRPASVLTALLLPDAACQPGVALTLTAGASLLFRLSLKRYAALELAVYAGSGL